MDLDQSRVLNRNLRHQATCLQRLTDQFISNQFSRHNEFSLLLCIHGPISVHVLCAIPTAVEDDINISLTYMRTTSS